MPSVKSVAKELVRLSTLGEEPNPMTNLALQKLLYYAQAWSLVVRETQLFPEALQAWPNGPVVPAIAAVFPDIQKRQPVALETFADAVDLPPDEAEFIAAVWDAYKLHSPEALSQMTHAERPWIEARLGKVADEPSHEEISVACMQDFFADHDVPKSIAKYERSLRAKHDEADQRLASLPSLDVDRVRRGVTSPTPSAKTHNANR